MPVYIAKIIQDNQIQELIVRADNVRAAKRMAQPKVFIDKLTPEQVFDYMKSGLALVNAEANRDPNTMDMFPIDFSLVTPQNGIEKVEISC